MLRPDSEPLFLTSSDLNLRSEPKPVSGAEERPLGVNSHDDNNEERTLMMFSAHIFSLSSGQSNKVTLHSNFPIVLVRPDNHCCAFIVEDIFIFCVISS